MNRVDRNIAAFGGGNHFGIRYIAVKNNRFIRIGFELFQVWAAAHDVQRHFFAGIQKLLHAFAYGFHIVAEA